MLLHPLGTNEEEAKNLFLKDCQRIGFKSEKEYVVCFVCFFFFVFFDFIFLIFHNNLFTS